MTESSRILKERIKKVTNVEVGRQTLKFNNKKLMNDKTFAYYDMILSAELVLEVTPLPGEPEFNSLVKFRTQKAKFKVKETTLVAELRAKIARLLGNPSKNSTLILGYTAMLDGNAPVSAYYLCKGSRVQVKDIERCN